MYYVNSLGARGFACSDEPYIYIDADIAHPETLAHELGHAMGLDQPDYVGWGGHTQNITGFEQNNLMWYRGTDVGPTVRWDLSLGQAFRINVDKRSWLNATVTRHTAPDRCCGCNPYCAQPCPALASDVTPVALTGSLRDGVCADLNCPASDCVQP